MCFKLLILVFSCSVTIIVVSTILLIIAASVTKVQGVESKITISKFSLNVSTSLLTLFEINSSEESNVKLPLGKTNILLMLVLFIYLLAIN